MSSRRAVYAAKFLKPPGFFKRAIMRDKPRVSTGPYENPVRKMVRLREKAREFEEIVPMRKSPIAKIPQKTHFLKPVQGVPKVKPEALQARLDFLLSDRAIAQQRAAPLMAGHTTYTAELVVWEWQMREIRKIYRAQYLMKLAQVTAEESRKEMALFKQEQDEKRKKMLAKSQAQSIEMKRAALLKDRKRIESKVNEPIEMTRRSKLKMRKLAFLKRIQDQHQLEETSWRNVSVPFLARQVGGAVDLPKQKNRRIHSVDNVYRNVLEQSYEIHPEHEEDFLVTVEETGLSPQQRAELYYTNFSPEEKLELIEQKIHMLQERQMVEEARGSSDPLTAQLMDLLAAAKAAHLEKSQVEQMIKSQADQTDDPSG